MVEINKPEEDDLFETTKIDYIEERNYLLRDVPFTTVRRAWFTLSHLMLDDNSRVMHLGCEDGMLTYTMAALNPRLRFIGVDKSKQTIKDAKEKYILHNLEFKVGDVSGDVAEPESLDAIINSFTLHQVYSNARYNERMVSDTLRKQFSMLKDDGLMFIRDYAKPPVGEFVLIEMHDEESKGDSLEDLSEADLLVWYSEHAQPKQDPGCGGFFLEELPPRFPRTRLFRLPYKWAYEFIMRKDNRDIWESHLPFEYTFFSVDEFRHELRSLGARMEYSAPHWDEDYIRTNFEGHFRLLKSDGDVIGDPPTSFIAVARKLPERSSLNIQERRITLEDEGDLVVKTMRDQKDGTLVDVVTRDMETAEIIPYRINDEGRLYIYLHDGVVRGITNAVARSGANIDGREWSGHMTEAITTDIKDIVNLGPVNERTTAKFLKSHIGLKQKGDSTLKEGPVYYPDPNYIDERVHTYYVEVADERKAFAPKRKILEQHRFQAKGVIREFNAQQILDAIAVGLIPNSRLELQLLSLMQHIGVKAENWIARDVFIASGKITQEFKVRDFLKQVGNSDKRFKEVKGSAGQLRAINSIFVEEGFSQGGRTGISSEHLDFVLSDEKTINTAVVLPLTKSIKGDVHAGFTVKHMPIPQRFEGKGLSASVPQFNIPKEIVNYKMLKQFIAEKFGVTPDMVLKLGESYYSHVGITPQRIHPFAIAAPPTQFKDPSMRFMPIYQYMLLWKSISKEQHFMTTIARAYRYMPGHMKLQARRDVKVLLEDIFKSAQPDWSMPQPVTPTDGRTFKIRPTETPLPLARTAKDILSGSSEEVTTPAKAAEEKIKKKRKKKKLGIAEGKDAQSKNLNAESPDETDIEEENQKAKKHLRDSMEHDIDDETDDLNDISDDYDNDDVDLVDDFQKEIEAIRQALEDEKNEPKPE